MQNNFLTQREDKKSSTVMFAQDSSKKESIMLNSPKVDGKKRSSAAGGVQFMSRNSNDIQKSNSSGLYIHGDSGTPSYHQVNLRSSGLTNSSKRGMGTYQT